MDVKLTNINAACTLSTSSVNFGTYNAPTQNNDIYSSSQIAIYCGLFDIGKTITVKLNTGNSNNYERYMVNNSNNNEKLYYNLYLDNARTRVFGNGSVNTSYYSTVIFFETRFNIFASLFKGQNVIPGSYRDNIVYILDF